MLSRNVCMTAQVAVVFAPSLLAQLVGDPVWDYCSGKGSICEASTDMLNECSEKDGEEYYKCICTSGYIPTDKQCQWCKEEGNMNGFFSDNFANMCESEGYDIAPIPEEIVSQQEERNETTSMPEVTYTPTFTYTTPDVAPWTITFDGETAVTLPAIAEETVLTDAAPTLGGKKSFVWQCAAGLATVLLVIW